MLSSAVVIGSICALSDRTRVLGLDLPAVAMLRAGMSRMSWSTSLQLSCAPLEL
jgi:hypothetical protein